MSNCQVLIDCPGYREPQDALMGELCGTLLGWSLGTSPEERCRVPGDCHIIGIDEGCGEWGVTIVYGNFVDAPYANRCDSYTSCTSGLNCFREIYPNVLIEWLPGAEPGDQIVRDRLQILCGDSACCRVRGDLCENILCSHMRPEECEELGGIFHPGRLCGEPGFSCLDQGDLRACCFCEGRCRDFSVSMCESLGGIPQLYRTCRQDFPGGSKYCPDYWGAVTPCTTELFGPAQLVLGEGEEPPWPWPNTGYMRYRPDTWQIAGRRPMIAFQEQTERSQHYGKITARAGNRFSGAICFDSHDPFNPYGSAYERSDCPVVVQTRDNILGDSDIRVGYATFACPMRCPCTEDPC